MKLKLIHPCMICKKNESRNRFFCDSCLSVEKREANFVKRFEIISLFALEIFHKNEVMRNGS